MQSALAIFPFSLPVAEGGAEPTVDPAGASGTEFSLSLADRPEGGVKTAGLEPDAPAAAGTVPPFWTTTLPIPLPVAGDGVSALTGGDAAVATPVVTGSNPVDQSPDMLSAAAGLIDTRIPGPAIPGGTVVPGSAGTGSAPDQPATVQNVSAALPEAIGFPVAAPAAKDAGAMPLPGRDRDGVAPASGDADQSVGVGVLPEDTAKPFQATANPERSGKQGDGAGEKRPQPAGIAEMRQTDAGSAREHAASVGPAVHRPGGSALVLMKAATESGGSWADVKKTDVPATDAKGSAGLGPVAVSQEPTGIASDEPAAPRSAAPGRALDRSAPQVLPADRPEAGTWQDSLVLRSEAEPSPAVEPDANHAERVSTQSGGFWEGLYAGLSELPTKDNSGARAAVSLGLPLQTAGHVTERHRPDDNEDTIESGKAVADPHSAPKAVAASALFQLSTRSDPVPPTLPISEILAGFDPASDDQEPSFGLPPLQGPQVSFVATASGSAAALPVPQVAAQITAALSRSADGATELALSPEELGHVRLRLEPDTANPDRLVVMISFERPETLDLFRRHAGELAEALRAAGYSGADIGFAQQGSGNAPDRREGFASAGSSGQTDPTAPDPFTPRPTAGTSLDLRL